MIDGTAHSLFLPPAAALASLVFMLAALALYPALRLESWRAYGRLGRAGAGLALGMLLALAQLLAAALLSAGNLQPAAATAPAHSLALWIGSYWAVPALLAAPACLGLALAARQDAWLGLAALPAGLVLFSLGGIATVPALPLLLVAALLPPLLSRRRLLRPDARGAALLALPSALALLPLLIGQSLPDAALTLLAVVLAPLSAIAGQRLLGEPPAPLAGDSEAAAAGAGAGALAGGALRAAPLINRTIADLPEGVAVFDSADRLIACNATYRRHNAAIADLLEIGAAYPDLVRAEFLRQGGGADPEGAIAEQLMRHRQLPWRAERPSPEGGTLLVIESQTAEGGTLRLSTDITAIKGRETRLTELAQRNEVLATAVGAVTSGIVICDATQPGYPVTFANQAFTRITGYAPDEIIGRNCRILQGRDTDREALDRLRRALSQQRAINITLRNYRKDGRTFWNELSISPVADESGRVVQFVGIMSDVTQRIRSEESLREAKNQAEFANRSKSEFLANVSHELRTPLNAIIGFSDVMKMELLGPLGTPRYQEYIRDIFDSGKLLLSLIEDILDLSKIESGKMELHPEPVSVAEVFDTAMTLMRERAKNGGITMRTEVAPDLPDLMVDHRAMKQIVVNLASNAVKFTPKGGEVTLTARRLDDAQAEIVVRDTGIGIARQDLDEVVKPFVQVDSAHQRRQSGTGLGLPIVKSLTDLSGGAFRLESELGKGTTITLHLPLAGADSARSAAE
ncbi:PAS domain S-box-containing protein [Dongia mobilis]|uniref:histidine kinase n=1 Tax=Dongia mobilis TaxID=578943 RepID=A0A4V3DEK6_9PROT|nr:ATP-binding protein [Dongia mobilis]TDQ82008.1 PAS domain S-box-containing protein [Dongia mobilis]